ncbi:hypothetical protein NMG60_11001552 [Bertholletia excelsa]
MANFVTILFNWFMFKALEATAIVKKIGKEDPRRITHSLKAGMWAAMTVVVLFEFTAGATLCKAINRGFATFFAGAVGVGASYLADLHDKVELVVLPVLVFALTTMSTFLRFLPEVKTRYDYGVMVFILTFALVSVSRLRVEEVKEIAYQRLTTVLAGAATCLAIAIFITPVWAGAELQNMIASNMDKLASFLEGFGCEYFTAPGGEDNGEGTKQDEFFHKDYVKVRDSKSNEESLANYALWEPCHGNFHFRHPWKHYLKVGELVRECAYPLQSLNNYLNNENKASEEFQGKIEEPCRKMSSECSEALRELALALRTMTHPSLVHEHIETSKAELRTALEAVRERVNLLEITPAIMVASTLIHVTECVDKIAQSMNELSQKAHFKRVEIEIPNLRRRGSVGPVEAGDDGGFGGGDSGGDHAIIEVHGASAESARNEDLQPSRAAAQAA